MTGCGWAYDVRLNIDMDTLYSYFQNIIILCVVFIVLHKYCTVNKTTKTICIISKNKITRLAVVYMLLFTYSFLSKYNSDYFVQRYIVVFSWIVLRLVLHDDKSIIWRRYINIVIVFYPFYR